MSEEPDRYGIPHCPRCESQGRITIQCRPDAPATGCGNLAGRHEHAICTRCGFAWVSAGEVPPVLRTPRQAEITISDAFDYIVNRPQLD